MKKVFLILFILFFPYYVNSQWVLTNTSNIDNEIVCGFESIGDNLFAISHGNYPGYVYKSTNEGLNWNSLLSAQFVDLTKNGNDLFAINSNAISGVYLSTNYGVNWQILNNGLFTTSNLRSATTKDSILFIGTYQHGIFVSYNNGGYFVQKNSGIDSIYPIHCMIVNNNKVYAGTDRAVYVSSNNGNNWVKLHNGFLYNSGVLKIAAYGNTLYAGDGSGRIYRSMNNGSSWDLFYIHTNPHRVSSIVVYENKILIAFKGSGIWMSSNNGSNWIQKNQGLTNLYISSMKIIGNNVFAGSTYGRIWKRTLQDITDIQYINNNIPNTFRLYQNYPNPFNPKTKIKFDLPKLTQAKLIIYDILGREVAILVNEKLNAGSYIIDWEGSSYPSGVYFYKLITKDFSQTKRMMLIK